MSELAREMQRKFPTLPRDYVWAIVNLHERRVNQRFLTCDAPDMPRVSLWSRIVTWWEKP